MQDEVERETIVPATPEDSWAALIESDWLDGVLDERAGFVEDSEQPRRLAFWWGAEGEDSTRVEITLEDADGGTLVRVVESRPLAVLDAYGDDLGAAIGAGGGGPPAAASYPPALAHVG